MAERREPVKPNIIYILADDLGYGDLGCYGQKKIKTPNLDRMAAEGLRFTQHYAGATVCAPSRCVLMTGLHTGHCLVRGNANTPLRPNEITLPRLLGQGGYDTALIGKWGLGEEGSTGIPNKQGFNYFFGYLNQVHAHNYYPEFLWRNQEKVPLKNRVIRPKKGYARIHGGVSENKAEYSHDLLIKEAKDFIGKPRTQPFFLYLALTIPHANNEAGRQGMEAPDLGEYENRDWPEPQKAHAAMISRMDRDVGEIFSRLKNLNLDKNTIVFFSSDNGPHREGGNDPDFANSNGPLRGIKRDLYEGGIRVPLIVRWPGKIKANSITRHVSGFQDVLPTCLALAGLPPVKKIDGLSMAPVLLGNSKDQKQHDALYWEFFEQKGKQAIRWRDWKGVRLNVHKNPDGPLELYDLKKDPGETRDISKDHKEIVALLGQLLNKARTRSEFFVFQFEKRKQD